MIDLVCSYDITGSLAACLGAVKIRVEELVNRVFKDIPGARIALYSHGNYADGNNFQSICETTGQFYGIEDKEKLIAWVKGKKKNWQGGGPSRGAKSSTCSAAYELPMNNATFLDWRSDVAKAMIVIGDEEPTSPIHGQRINYKNEVEKLRNLGVKIYGVHCLDNRNTQWFYEEISKATGGVKLTLDQFSDLNELTLAICYKHKGGDSLEAFAEELKANARMSRSLAKVFDDLSFGTLDLNSAFTSHVGRDGMDPVSPSRFQVMFVDRDKDIMEFVNENGARFKKGKGFYELTKSVLLRANREVVLVDKSSGDMFTGDPVRDMLGIPTYTSGNISLRTLDSDIQDRYTVFIQSTSSNRKLLAGTKFMYEVDNS